MIELIATVESITQAKKIIPIVDTIFFGEERFGLRLPSSFSRAEQKELVTLAHQAGKQVMVAVNGLMHPEKMKEIPEYLTFLHEIGVDKISVGDAGVVYVLNQHPEWQLPFVYDGETLVTSARQINFWAKKGASGAVLAREVPFEEMKELCKTVDVPVEVLVYGATCIHQSKRPLLQNYYNFTQQEEDKSKERGLFLSEPKKDHTHYSIYEDLHGTHIFANNDICLLKELAELSQVGYQTWKLDGLFTSGDAFVAIAKIYDEARQLIAQNKWSEDAVNALYEKVQTNHPEKRGLDTGFYYIDPNKIK
ncbi:peptidase U32 family protein [Candidatus Enterococcus willemsii]|uniref:Peptidase U32 n=1 Tax=Candidatus Enterococcus willemsii TaxID=1857215 RepID=A0ABQ6Z0W4_9ENTE|nr:peptidase U32 family protein [Enterococcus sp. CU12B]KAF1304651.1 peptidase U32 [Enterococcus sp. CU12B]